MSKVSSNYNAREELEAQYRTQAERKEEIREQNETEIENLKRNYNVQKADLEDRFERSIQGEKINQIEKLRNTKSQMQREAMQTETAGRQYLQQKTEELGKAEQQAKTDGEARLHDTRQKYAAAEAYERQQMLAAQEQIRGNHRKNAETILKDSERNIAALQEEKARELEGHQDRHGEALRQMSEHYGGLRKGVESEYQANLQGLHDRTQSELAQKQLGYAKRMEAYQKRSDDPFYRINRYDSDLLDVGDEYVLRVKVPDYERNQFRVQVAGQEIQLIGVRSNEDKAEVEPGRWIATNSHQTVSERYALDSPVDGRALTMREEGEWLEYHLPKFGKNHRYADAVKPKGVDREKAQLMREIEFPQSLPRPTISKKDSGGPVGSGAS